MDLISSVNALSSILRPSSIKKYKIHRSQPLNAVCQLLAATCIFCCVLCVLKQLRGGNTQSRLCLSDSEASKQGYVLLDCGPLGAPRCAQHPRASLVLQSLIAQVAPVVSRYVSKTLVKDNPIKKSLSKSNQRTCNVGFFSLWDGKLRIAYAPILSRCWGVVVVGWLPWGSGDVSPFPNWRRCKVLGKHQYNGMSSIEPFGFQAVRMAPVLVRGLCRAKLG